MPSGWQDQGEHLYLLGTTRDELDGSAWAEAVHEHLGGLPPQVSLDDERSLAELLHAASQSGLLSGAVDLGEGGLAQALADGSLRFGVGARVWIDEIMSRDGVDATAALFSESQGRVHTSAAGVLVFPDVEADQLTIDENDLRIDVFRASGPGGQGVNTTDSAVRITHLPTGVVVSCQNERSQLQNKESAMRMLRARLLAMAADQAADEAAKARRSQVRTVDRSERIRTYNFPENRIADHRIGYKAHNLDAVLDGALQPVLDALAEADLAERLAGAAG